MLSDLLAAGVVQLPTAASVSACNPFGTACAIPAPVRNCPSRLDGLGDGEAEDLLAGWPSCPRIPLPPPDGAAGAVGDERLSLQMSFG